MISKRHLNIVGLVVVLTLFTATGILFAQGSEESVVLFADDFSGYEIGSEPTGWNITDTTRQVATIEVVEDKGIITQRAAYFGADVTNPARTASMGASPFGSVAADVNTVVVDFAVKWVEGGAINIYLTKGNTHRVNLFINEGMIGYRSADSDGGRTRDIQLGQLDTGWNQVRVIANRETSQATIYLNDMDNPVMDGERFRNSVDSWDETRFIISHTTLSPGKAYYGDVNIVGLN